MAICSTRDASTRVDRRSTQGDPWVCVGALARTPSPRTSGRSARCKADHAAKTPCVVWLNHYRVKSEEDWERKKRRGQADTSNHFLHGPPPDYNQVRDDAIIASVLVRLARRPPAERMRLARLLGVSHLRAKRQGAPRAAPATTSRSRQGPVMRFHSTQ